MRQLVFAVFAILAISAAADATQLQVGDSIPYFNLPYATKDTIVFNGISSRDLAGQSYILAFYPADWSPGCTKEVCTFRDALSQFEELDITVFGVSVDNLFSHRAWAKDQNLNFKLLSDQTRKYGMALGVYNENSGVFKRSLFVVGPDSKLLYVDYDYSVKDNADFELLQGVLKKK